MSADLPDVTDLRACFEYSPENGGLIWKSRPDDHFDTPKSAHIWRGRFAGKRAGAFDHKGYLAVTMTLRGVRQTHKVHRIVWALATGSWPALQIDHANGHKADNRLENLREATPVQNMRNRAARRDNKVGAKGVVLAKTGNYKAQIKDRFGRQLYLGTFTTKEAASSAYAEAVSREHGEFARVG